MIKKQLCAVLCILILLSISNVVFAQQSYSENLLRASYVKFSATEGGADLYQFPQTGTTVFASTDITNNGSVSQAALLWVGVYKDKVMVDAKFKRLVIPEGATQTFTTPGLTIKEGYTSSNTQIIAYVWTSFFNANSIAASANFLKDNGDLKNIYINGVPLPDFHNSISQYTHYVNSLDKPVVTAEAIDNATKAEVLDFTYPGIAEVQTTSGSGAIKTFQLNLMPKGTITSLVKNPMCPAQTAMQYGEILDPGISYFYVDRTNCLITYVPKALAGATIIRMPLNDVRTTNSAQTDFMNSNHTYYTFQADMPGAIYAFATMTKANYNNPANGWMKLNSGTVFNPVEYNGRTYIEFNKYTVGSTLYTATTPELFLPKETLTTGSLGVTRWQSAGTLLPYIALHRHVYVKHFNAGETVEVTVTGNAATYADGVLWLIKWGQAPN